MCVCCYGLVVGQIRLLLGVCLCVCVCACVCACVCVCESACACVSVCICMFVFVFVRVCVLCVCVCDFQETGPYGVCVGSGRDLDAYQHGSLGNRPASFLCIFLVHFYLST